MVKGPLRILLFPVALLYGLIIRIRNYLYDSGLLKSHRFKIPIISVGNLTVGGSGKTPHIEYLIGILSKNFRVAVLSRGYKRKTKGFLVSDKYPEASLVGDEPAQIKRKFPEIVVAVDSDRVNGINQIIQEFPDTEVILLDDAFQHRSVDPGINILLTEYSNPFSRDFIMPFGRLREHRKCRRRADFILITKSPLDLSPIDRRLLVGEIPPMTHQHLYFTSVVYKEPIPLFNDTLEPLCLSKIAQTNRNILLITGIASPSPLFEYLNLYSKQIVHLRFPDHHYYSQKDIDRIVSEYNRLPEDNRCVITTEKDSVRLNEIPNFSGRFDNNVYYIPIGIMFLNNDSIEFNNFIINNVRKTKSHSIIPER